MEMHGIMSNKVSTCLYISREVLETARLVRLNISKVAENALVEAIERLGGSKPDDPWVTEEQTSPNDVMFSLSKSFDAHKRKV